MGMQRFFVARLFLVGLLAQSALGQGAIEHRKFPPLKGPYVKLTDNFRDHTNFNVETVRGMASARDGTFYAINTHGSMLVWFADGNPEPAGNWGTLNNPVSLAVFDQLAFVVGGTTHALAVHDRFTGEILSVVSLPSEPGDLVIDETTSIAYICSQAENVVVALDVSDPYGIREIERHVVPGEAPRFLNLDTHPVSGERVLIVAPMLSGNNTVPRRGRSGVHVTLEAATGDIYNVSGLENGGLPDEDLIVLPLVGGVRPAQLSSGREAGTLMLEHARNPLTGEYWALTVDLHNDIAGQRGESELRGIFATNALSIFAPDALSAPRDLPDRIIDLDDEDPFTAGPQYSASSAVSFPYALTFVPETSSTLGGWGFIASSTGDRVAVLDPNGNRLGTLPLPAGAIPRDLIVDEMATSLGVYCWGTNEILVFLLADLTHPPIVLALGVDPTPASVKAGRAIFYDADPSLDGHVTCASCHVAGGSDLLAWKLSGLDDDQKDIMVTQSLIGIQDTPGYHWREERSVREFNGAFVGLLGHDEPLDESPGSELDNFVDFLFSLQPHANHEQSRRRVLDDAVTPQVFRNGLSGSAVRGQDVFLFPTVLERPCGACHLPPSGTAGVSVADGALALPRAQTFGVAHLRQLNHRDQDIVVLSDPILGPDDVEIARGGFGLLHSGVVPDILAFAQGFKAFTPQQHADMAAYMHQYDQGTAPAVHVAIQLDVQGTEVAEERIRDLLLRQARRGWIDVVATGRTTVQGQPRELRWLYRPGPGGNEGVFEPDGISAPNLTLAQLSLLAQAGIANYVFLGLPPGNGEMWAHDRDGDGLGRQAEASLGTDPEMTDTDGDTFPDGYEVLHGSDPLVANASVNDTTPPVVAPGFPWLDHTAATFAKFFIECDEPVRLAVEASVAGGPTHQTMVRQPARRHTVVIQGLDRSFDGGVQNRYVATIRAIDLSGNETVSQLEFEMLEACRGIEALVVNDLQWVRTTPMGNTLDATAEILVEFERDAPFQLPAPGQVVVAQVFYRTDPIDPWRLVSNVNSTQLRQDFDIRTIEEDGAITVQEYNVLPGPFLLSPPTDAQGRTLITFNVPDPGVPPGGALELRLGIQAVLERSPGHTPAVPVFEYSSIEVWSMPATASEHRGVEFAF
jgi:hypothetical protein